MRGVTKHSSMKDWLRSKAPGSGGGGGKFLSGWKGKDGKGQVDTWLHTKCLPMTVWRHQFPTFIVLDDKKTGTKVTHVWSRNYTCHETEDVLDKLYWREVKGDPSSARDTPPERCGMCKFAEWCWQQSWRWLNLHRWVSDKDDGGEARATGKWLLTKEGKKVEAAGKSVGVDPCAVLFDFESKADPNENTVLHVGGFCGLFGRDELPEDLLKAMQARKIRQKEAWRENCMVKPKSVMCVVDHDKPEKGVQISEETKELGEKVKEEITKVWEGAERNIQKDPYCIRWSYDRSRNMGKQYTAMAVMKLKPDTRILTAIRGEAPDLSNLTECFNQQALRAVFERHCKVKEVPWSEIFPSREQEKEWAEQDATHKDERTQQVSDGDEDDEEDIEDADDVDDREADEDEDDAEVDDDGEELVKCDACGKPHKVSATKCPHCGHDYEVEEEPEEEEEKPPVRTRAEAKAAKKSSAKKVAAPESDDEDDDQGDGLPF